MLNLDYHHVDVFSRQALQGNGLVVVLDTVGLSRALQQQVPREVRQFATVFVRDVDLLAIGRSGSEHAASPYAL